MIANGPGVLIDSLVVTDFAVNCYLVKCQKTGQGAVIDPGGDAPEILALVKKHHIDVQCILITHGHGDHIMAVPELKAKTNAPVCIHPADAACLTDPDQNLSQAFGFPFTTPSADRLLNDGDTICVGELTLEVIHTPGHTPGGITLRLDQWLFTGDTLFAGSVGRSDFPGGSHRELISSIKNKLMTFDDRMVVLPGHERFSTIGQERNGNPFL
jgi:glyoxylase-like metal-dependent hydrolase (beta-lactamase superfamily II)